MTHETLDETLLDTIVQFYRDWYMDDIARLAQAYPKDQTVLEIDFGDLRRSLPNVADDYLEKPDTIRSHLEEALTLVELPIQVDLGGATVRVSDVADAAPEMVSVLTQAAEERIQNEYVTVRQSNDEDGPVPTTPRMNESLIRLAEAAARIRLSETVSVRDVERAADIYWEYLSSFGVDPETEELDADVVETGTSGTQRDRIKAMMKVIESLEVEYDSGAPISAVLDHPTLDDWSGDKLEHTIETLKEKGEIYEPNSGHVRTT